MIQTGQLDRSGAQQEAAAPTMIAEFRLLRSLGRGGMGEVFLGHDTLLDRPVAVKLLQPRDAAEDGPRGRYLVEARAAARVQHPNVVTVYRVGEVDGRSFIVTELLNGTSLDELRLPLPQARVLEIAIGLCRGLAAAHRRGVLHRDIKPGNAMLTEGGEVKLLDFGLAKLVDLDSLHEAAPPADRLESGVQAISKLAARDLHNRHSGGEPAASEKILRADGGDASADGTISEQQPGAILGTPRYMAPEIWSGLPASRRSDVYSMGVLLYELCTGETPFASTPVFHLALRTLGHDAPSVLNRASGLDPKLAEIVDRCVARSPAKRFASGEELREALEQLHAQLHAPPVPEGNPYRGLLSFEAEHRHLFFGRDAEIGTILERLRSDSFVLVAGDSGAGKSSLCRAGVVPRAIEGAIDPRREMEHVELVPGRRPLEALSAALAPVLRTGERDVADLVRKDPAALRLELTARLGERRGLLVLVDQLEELLTLSDADEAALVSEALGRLAARNPAIRLLATLRGDFLARATALPGLSDELTPALYLLRPLTPEKVREAVVGPARVKGVTFESDELVETIVASAARAEGSLPLLQFALAELWEAKPPGEHVITARSLSQIGGVDGALARHADHVIDSLPAAHQAAARRILCSLVTLQRTRARKTDQELTAGDPGARAALDALVRGRLLVARESRGGTACEIAHEALLAGWFTLRKWLDEEAEARVVKDRLERAAADFKRLGGDRGALWGAAQIAEAERLDPLLLGPGERAFLAESRRRVARARRLKLAAALLAPVLIASIYAVAALRARGEVDDRIAGHMRRAAAALAQADRERARLSGLETRALAAFDGKKRDEGEALWGEARRSSDALDALYREASREAAAALALDGGRADVRRGLAEILYKRTLHAEHSRRPALEEELRERLDATDATGEFGRLLAAPARLRVSTEPPGANVELAKIALPDDGPARADPPRDLGAAPLSGVELSPGSYLLTLRAPGRAEVRYPILAKRAEDLPVRVVLPKDGRIPEGFVYVPEGTFLFGSSDDEKLRRSFFVTSPLHEVTTGNYVIARHETTFGEWIELVRTLPATDPLRQPLSAGAGGITGSVELRETPDGSFQLTLQLATRKVTARSGEPLVIPGRKARASQDWLRFPVSGLSLSEVRSYLGWLDRTGRVPGARLCTEHEWERAARGADGRPYPHGRSLAAEDANFDQTYGKDQDRMAPDEIGAHPLSTSPFGVADLAGNAFEWVQSSFDDGEIVGRGGAYFFDEIQAQAANRVILDPSFRDPRLGVRVCASFDPN
jgi:serine/threonine protein kinase/formylglycine-generating enzyme required for sulfatase activity